jgi:hypothetical protein
MQQDGTSLAPMTPTQSVLRVQSAYVSAGHVAASTHVPRAASSPTQQRPEPQSAGFVHTVTPDAEPELTPDPELEAPEPELAPDPELPLPEDELDAPVEVPELDTEVPLDPLDPPSVFGTVQSPPGRSHA